MKEQLKLPKRTTEIWIKYTNHQGVVSWRRIQPITLWCGKSPYHTDVQYFLKAIDLEKQKVRDFAMRDIQPGSWVNFPS